MPIFDIHSYFGGSVVPGVANSPVNIMAAMQERGIDAAVLMSAHAGRADPLAGNRILRKMLDQGPNLYGCLVTHVNRVEASVEVMREQMGSRKFVAMAVMGNTPGAPVTKAVADDIVNAYRRYTKPLFLFTPNADCVRTAVEIAKGYPMLKFLFLGMGGPDWRAGIAAAHSATNVLLECSGALDRSKLPAAVDALGSHRILFGSSTPHVDAAAAVGLVHDSPLTDESRRRILYDNARRLFNLVEEA